MENLKRRYVFRPKIQERYGISCPKKLENAAIHMPPMLQIKTLLLQLFF